MDTKLCILCLTNNPDDAKLLFGTKVGSDSLMDVLRLHFWELNEQIVIMCKSCLEKVVSFHEFYLEVRNIHDKLKDRKSPTNFFCEVNIKNEPGLEPDIFLESNILDEQDESKFDLEQIKDKSDEESSGKEETIKKNPKPTSKSQIVKTESTSKSRDAKRESWRVILQKKYYDTFLIRFSMQCQLCSVPLPSLDDARKHYRSQHNRKGYLMCVDCNRPFSDYSRIVDHLEWHDDPNKFACPTCSKTFIDGTCMRKHIKEIHADAPVIFKCDQCHMKFTRRNPYVYHMKSIHSQNEDMECNQCKKKFKLKESFRYHIRKVHKNADSRISDVQTEIKFDIEQVTYKSDEETDNESGEKEDSNQINPEPSSGSQMVKTESISTSEDGKRESWRVILQENYYDTFIVRFSMQCEQCSVPLSSLDEARKHYRSEHNRKGYLMCLDCNRPFSDYCRIVDHLEWHEDPNKFTCTTCSKTFVDGTCMRKHIKEIHADAPIIYKCDECDLKFTRRNPYVYHMKSIHAEDENIECNHCKKKFKQKEALRYHIKKVHENGDSRICDICAKFFKCSQAYESHYKVVHTNTMQKVKCDICDVWLKHTGVLKEHMNRYHKRPNVPQICKYCGKTTPNRQRLLYHIRNNHSNVSYACHICEKSFKQKLPLKEHMAIHSGDTELYTCSFCPKTFRSGANMYAHRKRAHPIEYQQYQLLKMGGYDVKI